MDTAEEDDRMFSHKELSAAKFLPHVRLITWRPPRLPLRGVALLVGPLNWEIEINPDDGTLETAVIGLSVRNTAWHLDLLGRRLTKCS